MDSNLVVQAIGVAVNAIVAGIVYWYTIETKKIRQQGWTQLELMQAQLKGSQEQSEQGQQQIKLVEQQLKLFADEVEVARDQLQLSREQARLTQKPYVTIVSLDLSTPERWQCVVNNPTERICHHIHILRVEKTGGDVNIWSCILADLVMEESTLVLEKDHDLMCARLGIESVYGPDAAQAFVNVLHGNATWVVAFYQDVEDRLYMDWRLVLPDAMGHVFGPCHTKQVE